MLNISSDWISRMPSSLQKQYHFQFSEKKFGLQEAYPETFLSRLIIDDETGIHSETKMGVHASWFPHSEEV
jgi:hypothetical protein